MTQRTTTASFARGFAVGILGAFRLAWGLVSGRPVKALREFVGVCPACGGDLDRAHRAGDGYAPEASYEFCLECGWQGEPE